MDPPLNLPSVASKGSLPRSRFLDVTQRSPKETAVSLGERCVTSKKRLRGRLFKGRTRTVFLEYDLLLINDIAYLQALHFE